MVPNVAPVQKGENSVDADGGGLRFRVCEHLREDFEDVVEYFFLKLRGNLGVGDEIFEELVDFAEIFVFFGEDVQFYVLFYFEVGQDFFD